MVLIDAGGGGGLETADQISLDVVVRQDQSLRFVPDGERDVFQAEASFGVGRRRALLRFLRSAGSGERAASTSNKRKLRRAPRKNGDPLRHGSMNSF